MGRGDRGLRRKEQPGCKTRQRRRGQILWNAGFGEAADLWNLLVTSAGGGKAVTVAHKRAHFPEQSLAIRERRDPALQSERDACVCGPDPAAASGLGVAGTLAARRWWVNRALARRQFP